MHAIARELDPVIASPGQNTEIVPVVIEDCTSGHAPATLDTPLSKIQSEFFLQQAKA